MTLSDRLATSVWGRKTEWLCMYRLDADQGLARRWMWRNWWLGESAGVTSTDLARSVADNVTDNARRPRMVLRG